MTKGPLGGPRPGADVERSLQVGFYANTLNAKELEQKLNESKTISEIVTFMEEEFSTQTSPQDISQLSTAVDITYNSPVLKLYSDTDDVMNRVKLIKQFFEDLTGGVVRDVSFDSR